MEERRHMRRFTLRLPCLIYSWDDARGELLFQTTTSNVSAGGAWVATDHPLPTGMSVQFNLLIRRNGSTGPVGGGSCISLSGQVVRSDTAGTGFAFSEEYRIVRTAQLVGLCRAIPQWLEQTNSGQEEKRPALPYDHSNP